MIQVATFAFSFTINDQVNILYLYLEFTHKKTNHKKITNYLRYYTIYYHFSANVLL